MEGEQRLQGEEGTKGIACARGASIEQGSSRGAAMGGTERRKGWRGQVAGDKVGGKGQAV